MRVKYRLIATVRVKNEEWILESWLSRTCEYADAIIALDNGSTDGSVKLLRGCPKVILVIEKPERTVWNELPDRNLLLDAARQYEAEWVHIIDPDEIMDVRLADAIGDMLSDRASGRHFFREITLWRSTEQYRVDHPEKYKRKDGTNQIVRVNAKLYWTRTSSERWRRRLLKSLRARRRVPVRKVGNLALKGIEGETRYHDLVRTHYHFADWDRAWYIHIQYAIIEAIQMRMRLEETEEVLRWATQRLSEEGLRTAAVNPLWGVLPLSGARSWCVAVYDSQTCAG